VHPFAYSRLTAPTSDRQKALETTHQNTQRQLEDLRARVVSLSNTPPPTPIPPSSTITPALLDQVSQALQKRFFNDVRALTECLDGKMVEYLQRCDEKLFEAVWEKLRPVLGMAEVVAKMVEGQN
jgi:hypothetical protein